MLETSKYKEAAELYINFLLDPEISKANAEYMYYASPNTAVVEDEEYIAFLEELHPDAYEILYEAADQANTDSFVNLPDDIKAHMSKNWTKLGATITEGDSNYIVYIICVVIIIILTAMFVANKVIKYRREREYTL